MKCKRSLPPGSEGVSPAEMAAKMAALPAKGGGVNAYNDIHWWHWRHSFLSKQIEKQPKTEQGRKQIPGNQPHGIGQLGDKPPKSIPVTGGVVVWKKANPIRIKIRVKHETLGIFFHEGFAVGRIDRSITIYRLQNMGSSHKLLTFLPRVLLKLKGIIIPCLLDGIRVGFSFILIKKITRTSSIGNGKIGRGQ